ncbi:MAG: methylated-DNA--[protein]-cysteine S-methyltransferase [Acidimicrobiaceae bacterium]|nr:methylated-DNA--[protein]-cysteine S-methyltransferase [Acidimicrobiaceae bacterium]
MKVRSNGNATRVIATPIGKLTLVASAKGLCEVNFGSDKRAGTTFQSAVIRRHLDVTERQLREYFGGKRKRFSLKLDLSGTAFQESAWRALATIPYGQTISYSQQAKRIRKPLAVRAVGSANGKNPVAIVLPCHRVISADGSLGGYAGGLGIKRKLLALESR